MFSKFCYFRNFSTFSPKILIKNVEKSGGEDIASYVRFNRNFVQPEIDQYECILEDLKEDDHLLALKKAQIRLICSEFKYFSRFNFRVPTKLTIDDMKILLKCGLPEDRQIYFIKSYFRDSLKQRSQVRKAVNREIREASR